MLGVATLCPIAAAQDESTNQAGSAAQGVELDVALHAGMAVRVDDPPALELVGRYGLAFGFRGDVFLTRHVSLGLGYEHLDLGREHGEITRRGTVELTRDLNSLWLRFRVYPYRSESFGIFGTVGLAGAWQSLDAAGLVWPLDQPSEGESFRCASSAPISFALGANLGFEAQLSGALRLVSTVDFGSYHLSDEPLEGCATGAGSSTLISIQAGLAYRFDLEM